MKFASILVPFNKALLRGYFPWYLAKSSTLSEGQAT